jgi:hypothetical protein
MTHQTLTAVIENALRESLARQKQTAPRQPIRLTTFQGQELQPGVDLDDTATFHDGSGFQPICWLKVETPFGRVAAQIPAHSPTIIGPKM